MMVHVVGEWWEGSGSGVLCDGWDGLWLNDDHDEVQIDCNKQHVFFML